MATQINLPNKEKTIIYGKANCKYLDIAACFISNSVYFIIISKCDMLLMDDISVSLNP